MRTELFHPPKTIYITVTNARRHLFELFDLIADHDLDCILVYKGRPAARIIYQRPASGSSNVSPGLLRALTRIPSVPGRREATGK